MTHTQLVLARRPEGLPGPDTWRYETHAVPEPGPGEALVKILYVSLDPAMRGWMNEARSYIPPVGIGEVMRAGTVGKVMRSQHPHFKVGQYLTGWGGVQEYALAGAKGWYPVDPSLAPLPKYLSALGMTGMTAYFGLLEVGQLKAGETVLVSGAAGAVGSVVGQIAKIKGCRAVGIAGGPEKCRFLVDELGFDAAIDYKEGKVRQAIKTHCPEGVDVYFDNVGGEILDAALTRINRKARIVICGAISQYNNTGPTVGPKNYMSLLVNRARMEGFLVFDYAQHYAAAAREMGTWMQAGQLKSEEHVVEGLDQFYEAFLTLFSGEKRGKLLLKVADDQ